MVKRFLTILFILLTAAGTYAQQPPLSAFVDRTELQQNDVFTLTVRVNADFSTSPPDMAALTEDFEQIGSSISSSFTIINNVSERWSEYRITLRPRSTGTLIIPAFEIGNESTQPITITVSDTQETTSQIEDFFLTSSVNKDEIYVQEELIYTVRIYFATPFDQGAQLSAPQADNAVIQQLGNNETSYQEVFNGLRYNVIERKYVMFPQSSGSLTIDPIAFNATVGRRRTGSIFSTQTTGGRPINLISEGHQINVKSKPESYPTDATWLPSSNLSLTESWSRQLLGIEVGEAVTRNLTIRADGISSSLLPALEYPGSDNLKYYPDQANREDLATQNGVTGVRSQGTAIVSSRTGDFTLPSIEVPWWNTETDTLEFARLPAYEFNVINSSGQLELQSGPQLDSRPPLVNTSLTAGSAASGISSYIWYYATAIFALAWLFSSGMWYRTRLTLKHYTSNVAASFSLETVVKSKPQAQQSEKKSSNIDNALRALLFACKENSLSNIRQALLNWGQVYFNNMSILSLEQLRQHIDDGTLKEQLLELENAMYGANMEIAKFDAAVLAAEIKSLKKLRSQNSEKKAARKFSLPPLYKN